jgi:hypothetical protein
MELQMRQRRWVLCAIVTALMTAIAVVPAAGARAAGLPALTCSARTLPVALTDPGPADQTMWGQLCYRGSAEPTTVQLLVHGVTYNHLYWNFPYGNGYYSYVDAATAAGYATFDIDRIGDGSSSHPPSADIDLNAGAVTLHDAVTALRSGAVDGHAFRHVILVGHSLGSIEAWIEDARYHDVDAIIITGALHAATPNLPDGGTAGRAGSVFRTAITSRNCGFNCPPDTSGHSHSAGHGLRPQDIAR